MSREEHANFRPERRAREGTPPGHGIQVEPAWRDLISQLRQHPDWRSIFVLGPSDSGKTTFCRYLAGELAREYRTAAIDCDPGQSRLGVPTTLALAWEPWDGQAPEAMRFVGATSPMGHFLQAVTGVRRLMDRSWELGAEKVVLDSCGYIPTDAGREFHFQTVDVVEPDYVVALQRSSELEPLLASFERRERPRVLRLGISPSITSKPVAGRQSHRERKFKAYFADGRPGTLRLSGLGRHGMVPSPLDAASLRHRLVALCDRRGFVLALAIVEGINRASSLLHLYAPPFRRADVASIQFGSLFLDRTGQELPIRPWQR